MSLPAALDIRITIRPETAADRAQISRVVSSAFERPDEARLVDLIRDRKQVLISLVAVRNAEVVGHVLVSPLRISPATAGTFGGLAPLSVLPRLQDRGIGGALMREAITRSKQLDLNALFLLGNPGYYSRFGFVRSHIDNQYGATDAFMHLELTDAALRCVEGVAEYVDAFGESST